jgi:cytochrome c556
LCNAASAWLSPKEIPMTRPYKLLLGAFAGVVIAGMAHADTAAQDIIVTRQAGFDLQGGAFDAIRAVVAAKGDVKPYTAAAKGIAAWAKQIPLVFPVGSETGHNTKAKPEIWSDRAGFAKDANDLATAADKLAELTKAGDEAGVADQVKVVGGTCGACHRSYRNR